MTRGTRPRGNEGVAGARAGRKRVESAVLEVLREYAGRWVDVSALAQRAGVPRDGVEAAVEALRGEGYVIERRAGPGWRMVGCADRLIAREIGRELGTAVVGRRIACLERVGSTNDAAWEEALSGAEEGTVIFAEEQTAGRGRMGRRWFSPRGAGLWMSVVFRPALSVQQSHQLTAMASVAVAQAMREEFQVAARIRWPNDVYIENRKVAGILVEGRALATGVTFVVGVGVNVNAVEADFPVELQEFATSLAIETGRRVPRVDVAQFVLRSLDRWYRDLCSGDMGRIANEWRQLSSTLGRQVALAAEGHEYRGTVLDLSMEDGLIVRLDSGLTRVFRGNSVTLRHLSGGPRD